MRKLDGVEPLTLAVSQADLDDLGERLDRVRWPEPETVSDNSQGPQLAKLQALVQYWRDGYDWRACEALLNRIGQFRVTIDGLAIHFLHIRSPESEALPLLLCHGWPGSVLEFRDVIGPLSDPARHGGDSVDAFDLVIPSLPGFGFSGKPTTPGWNCIRIADVWIELMTSLGYDRWGAQGGDFGSAVCHEIARREPPGCVGMHLNLSNFQPDQEELAHATAEERGMLADQLDWVENLSGYANLQRTRPQTIGYSLDDSPVGLAAWIYAIFQDVGGTRGDAEASFSYDELLDNIMLYWLPKAGASSARLYWETQRGRGAPPNPENPIVTPVGFSMFASDHYRKSLRWLKPRYSNIVYFNQPDSGGHFAALEQPVVFADDVRATFRALR